MIVNSFHTSGNSPTPRALTGCRIGLLGFGTVGSAVARRLALDTTATPSHLALTHVFDRRAASKREAYAAAAVRLKPEAVGGPSWTADVDDVLTSDVDVVVEAIGGVDDALAWSRGSRAPRDIRAIARDRAAIVPAPRLSRPDRIKGFTYNAESVEHAEPRVFGHPGGRCVESRIEAEVA